MHSGEGYQPQEAISHTEGENPGSYLPAEAISHKRKRKGRASESSGNSSGNHNFFQQAPQVGANIACLFADDECIPLWPQYVCTETEGTFLRVGGREAWMLKILAASKRTVGRADDPCKHVLRKLSHKEGRHVAGELVRDLQGKLRDAVATAKKNVGGLAREPSQRL